MASLLIKIKLSRDSFVPDILHLQSRRYGLQPKLLISICSSLWGVGKPCLRAHLVWGFPCEELLPEEPADERDPHSDTVPLPQLERSEGSRFHKIASGFPQVKHKVWQFV